MLKCKKNDSNYRPMHQFLETLLYLPACQVIIIQLNTVEVDIWSKLFSLALWRFFLLPFLKIRMIKKRNFLTRFFSSPLRSDPLILPITAMLQMLRYRKALVLGSWRQNRRCVSQKRKGAFTLFEIHSI